MVTMKVCFKCGLEKSLDDFYNHKATKDGKLGKCKLCTKLDVQNNYKDKNEQYKSYDRRRQRYSKKRMFQHRYSSMKQRIEGRATRKYNVEGKELMSKEEYLMWCAIEGNMKVFDEIYTAWVDSGFNRRMAPSVDRIDNNKGYTADNIQWMAVKDNSSKYTQ